MTIYTYDTEFLEDGKTIELISIGIVSDDGREYYAINSCMPMGRIFDDEWLRENVWVHLPIAWNGNHPTSFIDTRSPLVKPKWVIANEVREFLLAGDKPELWAYYAAYDHVALAQLWGKMIDLPEGIPMWTHDLMQHLEQMPEDFGIPGHDGVEHNALADARWNMKLLEAMADA